MFKKMGKTTDYRTAGPETEARRGCATPHLFIITLSARAQPRAKIAVKICNNICRLLLEVSL